MTEKGMRRKSPVKAVFVVAILLACAISPVLTYMDGDHTVHAEVGQGSDHGSDVRYYVSIGDSISNGYGMFDYFMDGYTGGFTPDDLFIRYPADHEFTFGTNVAVDRAYPALMLEKLNEIEFRGSEWEIIQLANSGLRVDELRWLLDDAFYNQYPTGADGYMPNRHIIYAMGLWAQDTETHQDSHVESSDGRFCQTCMTEFREYYKDCVKSASLITINLGSNNFGTYLTKFIYDFMQGKEDLGPDFAFETYLNDGGMADEIFAFIFDALLYEISAEDGSGVSIVSAVEEALSVMMQFISDPEFAKAEISAMFDEILETGEGNPIVGLIRLLKLSAEERSLWIDRYQTDVKEFAELLDETGRDTGVAKFMNLLERVVGAMMFALLGHVVNYDASMEWILENCSEDTDIIVMGVDNIPEEMTFRLDFLETPIDVPLGGILGAFVDTANNHMGYFSPATKDDRVTYLEPQNVHNYYDQMADDEPLSNELWYHLYRGFELYYHTENCEPGCTEHLQELVLTVDGFDDDVKAKLVPYGFFHEEDGEYVIDAENMIAPYGMSDLADALHEILNVYVTDRGQEMIGLFPEFVEASTVSGQTVYSVGYDSLEDLAEAIAGNDSYAGFGVIGELAAFIPLLDDTAELLEMTEPVMRESYYHNALNVSTLMDPDMLSGLRSMGEKIMAGQELTDSEYSVLNINLKYMLSSGVIGHPDDKGHVQYVNALTEMISDMEVGYDMEADVIALVENLIDNISSEDVDALATLKALGTDMKGLFEDYIGKVSPETFNHALRGAFAQMKADGTLKELGDIIGDRIKGHVTEVMDTITDALKSMFNPDNIPHIDFEDLWTKIMSWIAGNGESEDDPYEYIEETMTVGKGTLYKITHIFNGAESTTTRVSYEWFSSDGLSWISGDVDNTEDDPYTYFDISINPSKNSDDVRKQFSDALEAMSLLGVDTENMESSITLYSDTNIISFMFGSEELAKAGELGSDMKFVCDGCIIEFGADVSTHLGKTAGDVEISMKNVDPSTLNEKQKEKVGDKPVIQLTLNIGGKTIMGLGGMAEVSFLHTPVGTDAPVVYHIDQDGVLTERPTTSDGETVTFETPSFSYYLVGTAADAENGGGEGGDTPGGGGEGGDTPGGDEDTGNTSGNGNLTYLAIAAVAVIAAAAIAFLVAKRKA